MHKREDSVQTEYGNGEHLICIENLLTDDPGKGPLGASKIEIDEAELVMAWKEKNVLILKTSIMTLIKTIMTERTHLV